MNRLRRIAHIVRSIPAALELLAGDADPQVVIASVDVWVTSLLLAFGAAVVITITFCTIAHL